MQNISDERKLALQQKADYFFKANKAIHIKFLKGYFLNGYIKEISADFFILDEFVEGEIPCFFLQIDEIDLYKTKAESLK